MKFYLKLAFSLLFIINGLSAKADLDSTYIKPFKNELIISTFLSNKLSSLDYSYGNEEDKIHTYYPNTTNGIGLGVAWNWFSLSATLFNFKPKDKYGKTNSFDFQTHWFFSKIQLSLSLQDYKGFYTEDEDNDNAIILRPDLRLKQYYAFCQYIFNNNKFSYMSSFSYDQQQLKSAGSLKVGFGVYYTLISADSSLIIKGDEKGGGVFKDFQIGPNVGYVYNWVFAKRFFITPSGAIGLGISLKNNDNDIKLFPTFFPRIALGYNGNNWTLGVSAQLSKSYISKIEQATTSTNSGIYQLTLTYRFPFDIKRILYGKK